MDDRLQTGFQSFLLLFEARFAEQREHVLLVRFDARLVERIDAEQIAADPHAILEEINHVAERVRGHVRQIARSGSARCRPYAPAAFPGTPFC